MAVLSPNQQATRLHSALTLMPLHLWHLLSLDAPTIAWLWTWFIARSSHIYLPHSSLVAMFIAVWTLYAADRLLDAQSSNKAALEARHHFHHRHRNAFLTGILIASITLAILLPGLLPEAIHLYLILGGLVFGYFILIHATQSAHRLPKESAVGICFAAATFIPTIARQPGLRPSLLPPALLFAALCSLNCLFIYAWEHDSCHPPEPPAHATTHFALHHLPLLAITIAVIGVTLSLLDHRTPSPVPSATALSAALLLLLHRRRGHLRPITLRAAADLTLLTPVMLLPFLHP